MLWEISRNGRRSLLAGTAHFFPYHFRGDLRRVIGAVGSVLLEGPLDSQAERQVVDAGHGRGGAALYDALDAAARRRILDRLGVASLPLDAPQLIRTLVFGREEDWLEAELRTLKPWLAFFGVWTRFRAREGWSYTLDRDAARIAGELGKPVRYLEQIDEQLAALESVPLERFVDFLALEDWSEYCEGYVRRYLAGDLDGLVAGAQAFPTYCEPIVARRDPILAERMVPWLEEGDVAAFIGISHCPGVLALLRERNFDVNRVEPKGR
jgi:hypothetical protein